MRGLALGALAVAMAPALAAQDTLVVRADNPPVWGTNPRLEEVLRIGTLEGDERYAFGVIAGMALPPDGSIWVADRELNKIRRFDARGSHLGDLGGEGRGPGEFLYLSDLRALPDGTVEAWDPSEGGRLTRYRDGRMLGTLRIPVNIMQGKRGQELVVDTAGRRYVKARRGVTAKPVQWVWLRVGPDGVILDSLDVPAFQSEGGPHAISTQFALSPRGYTIQGRNDAYAFTWRLRDGRAVRIERSWAPVAYGAAERAELQAYVDQVKGIDEWQGRKPGDVPASKPPWSEVQVDGDGRLWVKRYVPAVEIPLTAADRARTPVGPFRFPPRSWGEPVVYDVIEPAGRFLGTIELPNSAAVTNQRSILLHAQDEDVWVVEKGDYDEEYLVHYRVVAGS